MRDAAPGRLTARRHERLTPRLAVAVVAAAGLWLGLGVSPPAQAAPRAAAYTTAYRYVVRFYPRWFTWTGAKVAPANGLVAPARISPLYHIVVAINDDTLYASSFMHLGDEPVVLTIPETSITYSLLTVDAYGDVFKTSIPAGAAGTYALTGPGWSGTLPAGVTRVPVPVTFSQWIIRADKFSGGTDTIAQARQFRSALRVQTLSAYLADPSGGATNVLPEVYYALPLKGVADTQARRAPVEFLRQLQAAVHDPETPPLSPSDQRLSDRFDALFAAGGERAQLARAVRAAHAAIVAHYHAHTLPSTHWITFTNIGHRGSKYLDRDAITEYIQYGNDHDTAAYHHAFEDASGAPLDGSDPRGYVLTFPKGQEPAAKRFWSVTAYLPHSIELVPNAAHRYVVGSYTPGLRRNPDGSISIHLSRTRPPGVPAANWLPVPRGRFNVMLRVYGPEGSVADNTYVPPGVERPRRSRASSHAH